MLSFFSRGRLPSSSQRAARGCARASCESTCPGAGGLNLAPWRPAAPILPRARTARLHRPVLGRVALHLISVSLAGGGLCNRTWYAACACALLPIILLSVVRGPHRVLPGACAHWLPISPAPTRVVQVADRKFVLSRSRMEPVAATCLQGALRVCMVIGGTHASLCSGWISSVSS